MSETEIQNEDEARDVAARLAWMVLRTKIDPETKRVWANSIAVLDLYLSFRPK